jgi:prepilin-type N-terminal cleavage/methylation domain-containing protein
MKQTRRGFTLIELSIVMAIMAIAAAVVIPQLIGADFGNHQAALPGDQLMVLMRDSRKMAIQFQQTVTVRLDPQSGLYQVDTSGGNGTGMWNTGTLPMSAFESMSTDLQRLSFVFRPNGAAYGDSVIVRGGAGSAMITVDPWGGTPQFFWR